MSLDICPGPSLSLTKKAGKGHKIYALFSSAERVKWHMINIKTIHCISRILTI